MTTAITTNKFAPKLVNNPVLQARVLTMLGSGASAEETGKALGLHPQTVRAFAKQPDHKRVIGELRETNKVTAAAAIQRLAPSLWDRLEQALASGAARDVDMLSRAALNLEKVGASVAGENKPVPAAPTAIQVVFPSWAPPIQAEVIESQAEPLALGAADPGGDVEDFVPEPGCEPGKDKYGG